MAEKEESPRLSDFDLKMEMETFIRPPLWIIGPRSYFSDRAVPQLEIVSVPARMMNSAHLRIEGRSEIRTTSSFLGRKEKLANLLGMSGPADLDAAVYHVDLRPFGLGNWSHCLNQALPVAIMVRDHLAGLRQPAPRFILNGNISSKVLRLFDRLRLEYICTNHAVSGRLIEIDCSNSSIIHKKSRNFIRSVAEEISRIIEETPEISGKKIFLNRKPPLRSLTNNEEIRGILLRDGYQEVFMEDHGAEEQISMLARATDIVAIHGAALAPLMFRTESHGPFRFVEIGTPGHIVPFFRDMVEPLPCVYRMVRGVPGPGMSSDAYADVENPSMRFTRKHSLEPFRLDPVSLRFALDSVHHENFPREAIERPYPDGSVTR